MIIYSKLENLNIALLKIKNNFRFNKLNFNKFIYSLLEIQLRNQLYYNTKQVKPFNQTCLINNKKINKYLINSMNLSFLNCIDSMDKK